MAMCGQWRGQETGVLLLTVHDILLWGQNHGSARILRELVGCLPLQLPGHPASQRDVAWTVVTIANSYTGCGYPVYMLFMIIMQTV